MTRNIGNPERVVRAAAGIVMILLALFAPLPVVAGVPVFAGLGGYMLVTSLAGTCVGYKLMGRSTCPVELSKGRTS